MHEHSFLKEREVAKHSVLKERVIPKPAKPEWRLVVGKRGRKGSCAALSSAAERFSLECTNSFAALKSELNTDEEEIFSAKSDDEQSSMAVKRKPVQREWVEHSLLQHVHGSGLRTTFFCEG
eukprot:5779709-Amphidinium_carterae.2